jgi:succinyl-diaminopimelate desuccinylase
MDSKGLMEAVAADEKHMVDNFCAMLRIKAIGPENGGAGEWDRAKFLISLAKEFGFPSVEVIESQDPRAPSGTRPNIVLRVEGTTDRDLWVVTHMDVVPEGDISAWRTPPFDPTIIDGKIFARGAEDNGQELFASLYGMRALLKSGIKPELNVGLVFVSDEEHGNTHGIELLISKKLFKKGDIAVVPDHGHPDGSLICVVEKGIAWINVEVIGRQTHASTPAKGINALEVAAKFMLAAVERLRAKFSSCDGLFDPPCSTFEPTKCDSNGPNVNTVPGRQQFAFDFRVLPDYRLDDVMAELQEIAREHEKASGARINLSYIQRSNSAPKTSVDSEVVKRLAKAIETVRGVKPKPVGIGGGTCANPFRREGIEAAVWSTVYETAHDANEYCVISDLVSDAKVYALLFAGKNAGSP